MADSLVIDSVAEIQLYAAAWPVLDISASAISYPFRYSGPSGHKILQSQIGQSPKNILTFSRLAVVHGRRLRTPK